MSQLPTTILTLPFCPLTGIQIHKGEAVIEESTDGTLTYTFKPIGKAKIALPTYYVFLNNRNFHHFDLAGLCRNLFQEKKEPPLIDTNFINNLPNLHLPKTIKEKAAHFLKYMYNSGGKDYKPLEFESPNDFTIAYANSDEEFNKIMNSLESRCLINIETNIPMARHIVVYRDITLTDSGIAEVEKDLPKIPMIGLLSQEIATGDEGTDQKINHAKKLFLDEPRTLDKMRSACETLSYVLEPLRDECAQYFGKKDINAFFQIVNEFDIRHNKEHTKQITDPEQLEWVFHSLLNTINTYTKIKNRHPRTS